MEMLRAIAQLMGVSVAQLIAFSSLLLSGAVIQHLNLDFLSATDGFASHGDISHQLKSDGFQLSKNIFLSAKNIFEHIAIIGPTGAGKSTGIFLPNLLQDNSFNNSNSSIVVTDPKGELYSLTSNYQRKLGRNIKVFSPYNEINSIHYNPLDFCLDESDVIALARDILVTGAKAIELRNGGSGGKDSVWINMATPLFASMLLYVYKLSKPHNTISNALRLLINKDDEELEKMLLESDNENISLQYRMYQKCSGSGATASSIQVTLTSNVQSFLTPAIERITAYTDFNFKELRENKTILYLIYPVEKACDLAPLTSILFNQLFNQCKELNSDDHLPIYCLFDEFSNVGAIPGFNIHVSTLRSYRIGLVCCLQDKNQLKTLYGNHAETIFNNLKNLVLFGGEKDLETLRTVTALCGKSEVLNISTSNNFKGNTTTTRSYKTMEVMQISDLKNISENEILVMLKNQKPILDTVNPYYKSSKYLNNTI